MCIRHSVLPIIRAVHRETRLHKNPLLPGVVVLLLAACATAPPAPVQDKLDPKTGSTVSVLPDPVTLLTSGYLGARTGAFAYLGPFEVDEMGQRTLYLWVLVPKDVSATVVPVIQCDGNLVDLPLQKGSLADLGLAEPPYEPPDPWGKQWYFALTDSALGCLARAKVMALEIPDAKGELLHFQVESAKNTTGFPVMQAFAARRGTKGL
jgi:hypothetical protein